MENHNLPQNHPVLGGKAYLFKRPDSEVWHCAAYLQGRNYRNSTRERHLHQAVKVAEDWYFHLRGLAAVGQLEKKKEITFREVAERFMDEYKSMTAGQRSDRWVQGHDIPETPDGQKVQYVLDGQQRITSLYAAYCGAKIQRDSEIRLKNHFYKRTLAPFGPFCKTLAVLARSVKWGFPRPSSQGVV